MTLPAAVADLHLLRPEWLLVLPPLWALSLWLGWRRRRAGAWSDLVDAPLLDALRLDAGDSGRTAAFWPWLALLWTLGVLALAGPSWQREQAQALRAPSGLVIVLDLSPSMAASDLSPDRISRARYAIEDLLQLGRDTRVGLVVFSDGAYSVAPLTDDVSTVRGLLAPLGPELMPAAGDQLAAALARAASMLAAEPLQQPRVVVVSDGFADADAALTQARQLRSTGLRIDVIGIVSRSDAPLNAVTGGLIKDVRGRPLRARTDIPLLRKLADEGGGRFVEPAELTALTRVDAARGLDDAASDAMALEHWRDGGIWLLPVLLLLAAPLARRGWS